MMYEVKVKIEVSASDEESALRVAIGRLSRVSISGILQDRYSDIDREVVLKYPE